MTRGYQTGYKIVENQSSIMDEFKGFVRSKIIGQKEIKREIVQKQSLDDALSDFEDEDLPMMNH